MNYNININNVKVGDKFSTLNKLIRKLGLKIPNGNKQRQLQLKEIECYLSFKKTGKISRGKETNEIIITEIFDSPKEKEDNRCNNGKNGAYKEIIEQLLTVYIPDLKNEFKRSNVIYTSLKHLMVECGVINNGDDIQRNKDDKNIIKEYKYQLQLEWEKKVEVVIKSLNKKYPKLNCKITYLVDGIVATDARYKQIQIIKKNTRKYIEIIYQIPFFKAIKDEEKAKYYVSTLYDNLKEVNIKKIQDIIVFDLSDNETRQQIVDNNPFNFEINPDSIDLFLNTKNNLKDLFRKLMLKKVIRFANNVDELMEIKNTHNDIFNSFYDSELDCYCNTDRDDFTSTNIKQMLVDIKEYKQLKKNKEKIINIEKQHGMIIPEEEYEWWVETFEYDKK